MRTLEPTNKDRSDRGYRHALIYAHEVNGNEDIESAITDLIADLAHLADEYGDGGLDALRMGTIHYQAERDEE